MAKRKYNRRTDDEIIQELQAKIAQIQERMAARERKDSPVLKQIPRVRRSLQKFAQLAIDHGREDISNSTLMFLAGLERLADAPPPKAARAPRQGTASE